MLTADQWGILNVIRKSFGISHGAIVGAGEDVPPYAIVGGNPAKIIRYRTAEH